MDQVGTSSEPGRPSAVEDELRILRRTVERLARRVEALEGGAPVPAEELDGSTDTVAVDWSWLHQSAALRRVATISFVLVVALVLRTLTDNGIVDTAPGVGLGIGYAALVMAVGWRRLARDRPGQRVFPICGVVLLSALVMEAHERFEHLGAVSAHGLLVAGLAASAALALRYRAPSVAEAGCLAAGISAVVLGFPVPHFPLGAATVLLAVLVAAAVAGQRRVAWVHWIATALLLFFWGLWTFQLHRPLARGEVLAAELSIGAFLPALGATFLALAATAFLRCRARPTPFWLILPALNVAWAFAAAAIVLRPWLDADRGLGAAALAIAGLHVLLARGLARRGRPGRVAVAGGVAAVAGMAIAGAGALVPATWLVAGGSPLVLPLWSLAALGLAAWSGRLDSGGLRIAGALLQVGTPAAAVAAGVFATPPAAPWTSAALGALLAAIAGVHYRWTRATPPTAGSWYARLSPSDRPGVVALWASVTAAFCCLRVLIHPLLASFLSDVDPAFAGAQSVLLNAITIALLVLAWRWHSRSVLGTAALATVLVAAKVLAADLPTLHGVPLVLSVFSFGVTAAVESVILGRWQRASEAAA